MLRPSSFSTCCTCSAISGGMEKVMAFRVVGILSFCLSKYDSVITNDERTNGPLSRAPIALACRQSIILRINFSPSEIESKCSDAKVVEHSNVIAQLGMS